MLGQLHLQLATTLAGMFGDLYVGKLDESQQLLHRQWVHEYGCVLLPQPATPFLIWYHHYLPVSLPQALRAVEIR